MLSSFSLAFVTRLQKLEKIHLFTLACCWSNVLVTRFLASSNLPIAKGHFCSSVESKR